MRCAICSRSNSPPPDGWRRPDQTQSLISFIVHARAADVFPMPAPAVQHLLTDAAPARRSVYRGLAEQHVRAARQRPDG